MKTKKQPDLSWPAPEQLQKLRLELHKKISREELESPWRLEALDRIVSVLKMEPVTFHHLWIQPLLDAGLSLDAAVSGIAQLHFLPD